MNSAPTRTPHSSHQDDDLASVSDVAARPPCYSFFPRRGSLKDLSLSASASSPSLDERLPRQAHFLEACELCRKPIDGNKDIYMYRGDTPFCSEECRKEQIEMDDAKEHKNERKILRKVQKKSNSSSPQGYPFKTTTVAAA